MIVFVRAYSRKILPSRSNSPNSRRWRWWVSSMFPSMLINIVMWRWYRTGVCIKIRQEWGEFRQLLIFNRMRWGKWRIGRINRRWWVASCSISSNGDWTEGTRIWSPLKIAEESWRVGRWLWGIEKGTGQHFRHHSEMKNETGEWGPLLL